MIKMQVRIETLEMWKEPAALGDQDDPRIILVSRKVRTLFRQPSDLTNKRAPDLNRVGLITKAESSFEG